MSAYMHGTAHAEFVEANGIRFALDASAPKAACSWSSRNTSWATSTTMTRR
jgi:hypothetical protein